MVKSQHPFHPHLTGFGQISRRVLQPHEFHRLAGDDHKFPMLSTWRHGDISYFIYNIYNYIHLYIYIHTYTIFKTIRCVYIDMYIYIYANPPRDPRLKLLAMSLSMYI